MLIEVICLYVLCVGKFWEVLFGLQLCVIQKFFIMLSMSSDPFLRSNQAQSGWGRIAIKALWLLNSPDPRLTMRSMKQKPWHSMDHDCVWCKNQLAHTGSIKCQRFQRDNFLQACCVIPASVCVSCRQHLKAVNFRAFGKTQEERCPPARH